MENNEDLASLLRHQRDTSIANGMQSQYNRTATIGWIRALRGSTAFVTTDGTNVMAVDYFGGSIQHGDPVSVQLQSKPWTKGYEGL